MGSSRRPLGRHGLSIVLGAIFAITWLGQFLMQLVVAQRVAQDSGQPFSWDRFWPWFGQITLENWQGGFLQAFSVVILATYFIASGSPLSRDRFDTMQETLTRMEDLVDAIHFQLFEERTERTAAERYFDERRQDPDYDQAYRQAWRALQEAASLDEDDPGSPQIN